MSFLDNLENNLKALESHLEKDADTLRREQEAREAARTEAIRRAPVAEALRNGPFTNNLLAACQTAGHRLRTLIRPTWFDTTLRLDARDKRVELRPTAEGVVAVFSTAGVESHTAPVDLNGDAESFVRQWLEAGTESAIIT